MNLKQRERIIFSLGNDPGYETEGRIEFGPTCKQIEQNYPNFSKQL